MNSHPPRVRAASHPALPMAAGVISVVAGGLALLGSGTGVDELQAVAAGLPRMAPVEAVGFIASGISLWLLRSEPRSRLRLAAGAIGAVPLLIGVAGVAGIPLEARPAIITSLALVCLGAAFLTLDVRIRRGPDPAQFLALLAMLIALLALLGYVAGIPHFYGRFGDSQGMALQSAVTIVALGVGVHCVRPDRGLAAILSDSGADSVVARRLIFVPVLLPLVTGLLRQEGQRRGLYNPAVGNWLFSLSNIAIFTFGIWYVAGVLRRSDAARETAQNELRSSADRFLDLYDLAPCGYHSVGPDGVVIAMNRTELAWLGYSAEEVIGRMRFRDVVSDTTRQAYLDGFTRVREFGSITDVELELVRKDGTRFPVLVNSTSVRDAAGGYSMSRTTITDLTERKRAEELLRQLNEKLEERVRLRTAEWSAANEQLRKEVEVRSRAEAALRSSEQRYRSFVEASSQVVWITNSSGELDGPSPEWQAYTGQSESESRGFGWMSAVRPEDRDRVAAAWEAAVQSKRLYEVDYQLRMHDGTWRHIHAKGVPVLEHDGRIREWVGACIDITAAKAAEVALRQRSEELVVLNHDLVQKRNENEMFVYTVSHDLRSPLVNLQGFSKELEKGCRGLVDVLGDEAVPDAPRDRARALVDGKILKSIGFIQSAVMRLSGIIDALLRLSRAGRVEYRFESIDVAEIVARVVQAAQGTIQERGAEVRFSDLAPAWGDRTAIEQIFGNLIGNALNYLDPSRRGVIEVGCMQAGADGHQVYFVRDNGLGIPESHRARIFQAFQRAHPSVAPGEGLGLAIVSRVAERHRGRVWVESVPGEGSTFYVALPVAPAGTHTPSVGRP